MSKYKAYPEYKDSGVEWLGDIPNDWDIKSLKNIAVIVNGSTPKSGVEEYWDGDINWITPTDLSQKLDVYLKDSQRKITNEGLNSCGTSLVPENTVILSTRAPIGSLAITGAQSCTNQGCKSLVVRYKDHSLFLYYYLSISTNSLNNLGRGSTFLELSTEDLGSFKVPMPNEGIGKIVSFLDHETAKIDNLIEKQQQLIELLKEKRQAVISHAVTKGLNPDVPMKDSGVEWLGEVPEHWVISKIGYFCEVTKLTGFEYTNHWRTDEDGEIIALRGFNIKERYLDLARTERIPNELSSKLSRSKLCVGDIVLPCTGTLGNACVINSNHMFHINQNIAKLTFDDGIYSEFATYWLTCEPFRKMVDYNNTSGMQPVLLIGDIRNMPMPLPSIQEQIDISIYLSDKLNVYDLAIKQNEHAIRLLSERRTALISAAVTGKIDVRDWVAPGTSDIEAIEEATA